MAADRGGSGAGLGLHRDARVGEYRGELPGLEHLAGDVAAADEFALDVELGNRRPVGVFLDPLTNVRGESRSRPLHSQ